MSHFYLRVVQLPFLLLTAILLLIHAQPFDDQKVRQALLPDDCPAPCFLGIRPGVTSGEDAMTLLQASRWVGEIDDGARGNQQGFIRWDWSDQKPNWISENTKGKIWVVKERVDTITIYSDFRLGETQLVLGIPEGELVDPTQDRGGKSSLYTAFYNQKGLLVRNWQPCNVVEPFLQSVIVTYTVQSEFYHYPYRDWLNDVFHICSNDDPIQ
jgi:hypothetical protein